MAAAVITALGLDRPELEKLSMAVVEKGNADSSFILSCIMWDWLVGRTSRIARASGLLLPRSTEPSGSVCLLTSHHSLAHYRNQGVKLGFNMSTLQQKGVLEVHEIMKLISDSLHNSSTPSSTKITNDNGDISLQNLYLVVRNSVKRLSETSKSVCLIVGSLSDLLTLGVPLSDLIALVNYLRGLVFEFDCVSLVISSNICELDENEKVLQAFLLHTLDSSITVSGLQTGLIKDVSGTFSVRGNEIPSHVYHYRLMDRQVKVFAPGSSGV